MNVEPMGVSFYKVKNNEYLPIYLIAKDGVCFQGIEFENRRCFLFELEVLL